MTKRPQVYSESFDRGYAKGLMDAYGIIRGMLNESGNGDEEIVEMLRKEVARLSRKRKKPVSLEDADRDLAFKAVACVYDSLGGTFENEGDWDWEFTDHDLKAKVFDACAGVNRALAAEGRWWA